MNYNDVKKFWKKSVLGQIMSVLLKSILLYIFFGIIIIFYSRKINNKNNISE